MQQGILARLIRRAYYARYKDEDLSKLSHENNELRFRADAAVEKYVHLDKKYTQLKREVDRYADCVPLPVDIKPELVSAILKADGEAKKSRAPIDAAALLKRLVEICRGLT